MMPKGSMLVGHGNFVNTPILPHLRQNQCLVQGRHKSYETLDRPPIEGGGDYMDREVRVDPIRLIGVENESNAELKATVDEVATFRVVLADDSDGLVEGVVGHDGGGQEE